ncbi:MAG: sigma-70 family RNA polymerase sigma factor [Phycisphaerales bacterium]|nr:MAG: sigma-70 family RNA polymerase sigma factor [Phycisphaerales bacterium]
MPVALADRAHQRAPKINAEEAAAVLPPGRPGRSEPASPPATIDEVWRNYRRQRTRPLRDRLISHYMASHVRPIAERLRATLPQQVDVDDLIQQGYLGLIDALERFDPARNIRFETFSRARIFGAMRDYLRSLDPMPRLTRTRAKQMEAIIDHFLKTHGRMPSEEELRRQLEVPEPMLRKLMSLRRAPATVSFNGRNADGEPDEEEGDAMAALTDRRQPSPPINVARADLREWLTRGFSRRDRLIVILYYYEEMTMRQIGQTIGWSESRVSQRLDSIIGRLRARFCHTASEHEFQFT